MKTNNSRNTFANVPTYASILADAHKDFQKPACLYEEWKEWADELIEKYL